MDRLNPKDNVDLSFSDAPEDEEEVENFDEEGEANEDEGNDRFEDEEFGSDEEPLDEE